jgi:hypothetical protein
MEETRTLVDVGNGVKITMPCDKLMSAMAQMQAVLDMAKKDSDNPYFKSKYADLAQCLQTAKKPMADNGLSISQHCTFDGVFVQCVSVLAHSSGQMMVSTLTIPVSKKDAQGIGSSITYARRYALSAIVGIAQKDDDGNGSVGITQEEIDKRLEQQKAKEEAKAKAMAENQKRLDELENWRYISADNIEVKMKNGKWVNLDDCNLVWLNALRENELFEGIRQDIQKRIDLIKNAEK